MPRDGSRAHTDDTPIHRRAESRSDRLVRLSVNLSPEIADVLKEYAQRKGVSVTEAVRRAVTVLQFVDETQDRGASVVVNDEGAMKEIVFLV